MRYLILIVFLGINLVSCATYRAFPKGARENNLTEHYYTDNKTGEQIDMTCGPSKYGTKYFCRTSDDLFYAHIDPYQAVPCQKIEFYGECGNANSGSLWWNFGDNTTSSLKNGWKTYETYGDFKVEIVCTFIDGKTVSATIPVMVSRYQRGTSYSSFPGYWYGGAATEIKPGNTSCPRIELK